MLEAGKPRARARALYCAATGLALLAAYLGVNSASAGRADSASARVGPGPAAATFPRRSRVLAVRIRPNRAAAWDRVTLTILRHGAPVRGARVRLSLDMDAMAMGTQTFLLAERRAGVYTYFGPVLVRPRRWDLTFRIAPRGGPAFTSLVLDSVGN
jgi:hypothetical protein